MHVSSFEKAENTKEDFVFNLFIWKNSRNHGKWFYLGFKYPLKVGGLVHWAFFFSFFLDLQIKAFDSIHV